MTVAPTPGKPRTALGMGLDALLPDRLEGQYFLCAVEDIRPSPHQPRQEFPDEAIQELADSIREKGLIQPVILRRGQDGRYELIAGERRWRAAQRAGLTELPAVLRDADEEDVLELALIENLQREDLNPLDQAEAFHQLLDKMGLTQEEVAQRIGKSRVAVANTVRLLSLPPAALKALRTGTITAGHARAILAVGDEPEQLWLLNEIHSKGLSVRQAEVIARTASKPKPPKPPPRDPNLTALEQRLTRTFGTRVALKPGAKTNSGSITIQYRNLDDLDRILGIVEGTGAE
ncbi:MAG: ParB/RepB/Spo0J family partition protein [Deferrisomatales bacterium]|nr:ParB/RepB/Spo0J family partition protein [Deferrisomatales bacterium]